MPFSAPGLFIYGEVGDALAVDARRNISVLEESIHFHFVDRHPTEERDRV
jgi:hypothetical protein